MKKNLLIIISMMISAAVSAQKKHEASPKFEFVIIAPKNLDLDGYKLSFNYNIENLMCSANLATSSAVSDSMGKFRLTLPKLSNPVSASIMLYPKDYPKKRGQMVHTYQHNLIINNGDDIKAKIYLDSAGLISSISYSGNGFAKYEAANKIAFLWDKFERRRVEILSEDPKKLEITLLSLNNLMDSVSVEKNKIIEEANLDGISKKMINYENADFYWEWLGRQIIFFDFFKGNPIAQESIRANVLHNMIKYDTPYNSILQYCPMAVFHLGLKNGWKLFFESKKNILTPNDVYSQLRKNYNDLTRELLLSNFLISGCGLDRTSLDKKELDSLMKDAGKYIISAKNKAMYNSKLKLSVGAQVFNGVFKDKNGKDVSLSSLKGKVVMIDIWGWGCGSCAKYHQSFHKNAYPILKDEKDFVYLSISNDKTKSRWMQGFDRGIYTAPEYLNVFTGEGVGMNHPFHKYYAIEANPFLLLIGKDGKIVTEVLGNPGNDLKQIQAALSVPYEKAK